MKASKRLKVKKKRKDNSDKRKIKSHKCIRFHYET